MKKYLFWLIIVVTALACNKSETNDSFLLVGSWKMIAVKDKTSNVIINNPGNQGDVVITFTASKVLGKTPSNDIWPSDYTTDSDHQLSVPAIGGTKVGENSWGSLFYNNMYFIKSYSFGNKNFLHIDTRDKILNFERQ